MGVEYDIHCKDCDEAAGIGDGCSKNLDGMRAILAVRSLLEDWSERDIEVELSVGHGYRATPPWFARHRGHALMVRGSEGRDYTTESSEREAMR
jgi:hypothetical protein